MILYIFVGIVLAFLGLLKLFPFEADHIFRSRTGFIWWWKNRNESFMLWQKTLYFGDKEDSDAYNDAKKSLEKYKASLSDRELSLERLLRESPEAQKAFYSRRLAYAKKHLSIVSSCVKDLELRPEEKTRVEFLDQSFQSETQRLKARHEMEIDELNTKLKRAQEQMS